MKSKFLTIVLVLSLITLVGMISTAYANISPIKTELKTGDSDNDSYSDLCEQLHKSNPNDAQSKPLSNITINVPSDIKTIQEAINIAIDSDTIVVSQGKYKGNINFNGKSITITSTDPLDSDVTANTIIEATENGSVVTVDTNSVLKGLTITSKNLDCRGIYVKDASPTIENCTITDNQTTGSGGGIYISTTSSKPQITNCIISGNTDNSTDESAQVSGGTPQISYSVVGQDLVNITETTTTAEKEPTEEAIIPADETAATEPIPTPTEIPATIESTTMTMLPGWSYIKEQIIRGSTAGVQTNYQMRMTVHKGSGTDTATDIYCGGNCRDDFGDIRWTKDDGTTLMDYWIESLVSGNNAIFWVEIPSIPAYPGTVGVYMDYGNPAATSISNGNDTFALFDDFNGISGNSIDSSKWMWGGSHQAVYSTDYARSGTTGMKLTGRNDCGGEPYHMLPAAMTGEFVAWLYDPGVGHGSQEAMFGVHYFLNIGIYGNNSTYYKYRINPYPYGCQNYYLNTSVARSIGWHEMKMTVDGTNISFYIDGTLVLTLPGGAFNRIFIGNSHGAFSSEYTTDYFDDVRVRNYVSPEPTWLVYSSHLPIYINGNSDFSDSDDDGVINPLASGTESDPFIIDSWAINASSTVNGIDIRNTTAYFIIQNCLVKNGWNKTGIYLNNVKYGKIENNICRSNAYGSNNTGYGIYLTNSSNYNNLENNICLDNGYGIFLDSGSYPTFLACNHNTLINNICEGNTTHGIYLNSNSNINVLDNNTCSNNSGSGINLSQSSQNTLTDNICSNNTDGGSGIVLYQLSNSNTLTGNTCEGNINDGIFLDYGCRNNVLDNNTCRNNQTGIEVTDSAGAPGSNTLTNNICENNLYGIRLDTNIYSSGNIVTLNYLINNTTNNAYDQGTNAWDNNSKGNYWSDWSGSGWYYVPGGGIDHYPMLP